MIFQRNSAEKAGNQMNYTHLAKTSCLVCGKLFDSLPAPEDGSF